MPLQLAKSPAALLCWPTPLGLSHQFEILSGLYSCLVRRRGISFVLEVIEPCPQHAPHYFSPADLETAGYGIQAVEQLIVEGHAQPMGKFHRFGPFSLLLHF